MATLFRQPAQALLFLSSTRLKIYKKKIVYYYSDGLRFVPSETWIELFLLVAPMKIEFQLQHLISVQFAATFKAPLVASSQRLVGIVPLIDESEMSKRFRLVNCPNSSGTVPLM